MNEAGVVLVGGATLNAKRKPQILATTETLGEGGVEVSIGRYSEGRTFK
jgi:hypothetical protein